MPLSEIAYIVMGTSPKSSTYNEIGIGSPLINGPVDFGEHFPLKRKWTTAPPRFSISGDLVFCVRGSTTGRRIVADGEYCLGRGVCAIRANAGSQAFVNQTIDSHTDRLLQCVTGSVFPNLSAPQIRGFDILRPPNFVVEAFSNLVGLMQASLAVNVRESFSLSNIRDAILPKLISGELPVPVPGGVSDAC